MKFSGYLLKAGLNFHVLQVPVRVGWSEHISVNKFPSSFLNTFLQLFVCQVVLEITDYTYFQKAKIKKFNGILYLFKKLTYFNKLFSDRSCLFQQVALYFDSLSHKKSEKPPPPPPIWETQTGLDIFCQLYSEIKTRPNCQYFYSLTLLIFQN